MTVPDLHPYASEAYARAFSLECVWLPNARTHVLLRPIAGTNRFDAMGCYPVSVFGLTDDFQLDMRMLADRGAVSLVLVSDCLTQPAEDRLRNTFDLCRTYKTHHVYDARLPNADYSKHHRDRIRRALKSCEVRVIELREHLVEWLACYETLISKKDIRGIQAFGADYFAQLANVSGVVTVGAFVEGQLVSGHIWVRHGQHAYAHLAASTPLGYKLRCAFPIYDHAIRLFRDACVIDFGGGAGVESNGTDGLSDFKRGFANASLHNHLCGKVLDRVAYEDLCRQRETADADFFPKYRAPKREPAETSSSQRH